MASLLVLFEVRRWGKVGDLVCQEKVVCDISCTSTIERLQFDMEMLSSTTISLSNTPTVA